MRRSAVVAMLTALALALTACAGLPTSSGVNEGRAVDSEAGPRDVFLLPARPQPGATPEQIVDGFIRAGSGPGSAGDWPRAQEFLSTQFREAWAPAAGVTIDITGDRDIQIVDEDTVNVTITAVATVDDKGSYQPTEGGVTPLTFDLARQDDGEWRITSAPNGIVIDRTVFRTVFHEYPLAYFDVSWQYLVPDVRWFPTTNAATRIADALVNRPRGDWLAESVRTSFVEGVQAQAAVPVTAGIAAVTLSDDALLVDQVTRDRMQTQLEVSLSGALVTGVDMIVDGTTLVAETVSTKRTAVTGPPLVEIEEGFGFLSGAELMPVPGLSAGMSEFDPAAVQVSADRDTAAVLTVAGSAVRLPANGLAAVVDDRAGLLAPSIDPFGILWSVPASAPQAVEAHLPDGETVEVGGAWPGATRISAMAVSREGARMAAVVTSGGRTWLWLAGIVRAQDGSPTRLSDPIVLGSADGTGISLAWLDDTTVGVLTRDDDGTRVVDQLVGGPGTSVAGPERAVSIAGSNAVSSVRLRGSDGTLYLRRGANWQETATDILVLATQQGTPD